MEGECNQCGFTHPALHPEHNGICPMAKGNKPLTTNKPTTPTPTYSAPAAISGESGECGQCCFTHPPLLPEHKGVCPMAQNNSIVVAGEKVMANNLMGDISKLIQDQIKIKDIKDVEKLRVFLVVELAKIFQNYSDE